MEAGKQLIAWPVNESGDGCCRPASKLGTVLRSYDAVRRNGNQFFWLVRIGLLVTAFGVLDHCSAQQAPVSRPDIVRIPILEGRDIRFRKLHNPENLSHVRVESIVQDTQGFMWFGTWNGLNRYDGYKFKLFKHEAGDPKSLSGVYVHALFEDHSGNLWVGTEGLSTAFTRTLRALRITASTNRLQRDYRATLTTLARTRAASFGCQHATVCFAWIQTAAS